LNISIGIVVIWISDYSRYNNLTHPSKLINSLLIRYRSCL